MHSLPLDALIAYAASPRSVRSSNGMVGTSGLEPPTSRLSGVRSNHLSYAPMLSDRQCHMFFFLNPSASFEAAGGDEEDRTPDPLRARQVLSQLSYTPIFGSGFRCLFLIVKLLFDGCLKIEQ